MNKAYNKLIASYLAGEDVEQALIGACKQDEALLTELTQEVAFERVVRFALQAQSDDDFMQSFQAKLELSESLTQREKSKNGIFHRLKHMFTRVLHVEPAWRYSIAATFIVAFALLFIQVNGPIQPVGLVAKVVNAQSNNGSVKSGDSIKYGDFSLTQGYAEIMLNNGVALLLEAPVNMRIHSVDRIVLTEGNLVARVPNGAEGFKVDTPSAEIVDLGTEFGVSVDKKGESQVHVIDGEIKVRPLKTQKYELLKGDQARSFNLKQQVAIIQNQPELFMRTLPGKSDKQPEYVHWPLDEEPGNIVSCKGDGINGKCFDGTRHSTVANKTGPAFVQGKFGDGVLFNGKDDWLETTFKGIGGNKPRTVAFWVKVPDNFLGKHGFGILSWGLHDDLAAWQISPNPSEEVGPLGRIRIGINQALVVGTTDLRDNQWHHVAIVLFGGEEADLSTHVLMYVDGKLEKTATKSLAKVKTNLNHPRSKPLTMGRNIAFTNLYNVNQKYKFFKGGLDEVYIFDSALTHEHVLNLMTFNQLTPPKKQ